MSGGCGLIKLALDDDFGSGGGGLDFAVGDSAVSEAGNAIRNIKHQTATIQQEYAKVATYLLQ